MKELNIRNFFGFNLTSELKYQWKVGKEGNCQTRRKYKMEVHMYAVFHTEYL